jgi:hypothetical protein
VDGEGRVVAAIYFDPDDRRAASAELLERWARSDAARCVPAAIFEALRAVNAHDLEGLRALLPDDFVLHDHRRIRLGRLQGDGYLAAMGALFELAPDVTMETLSTSPSRSTASSRSLATSVRFARAARSSPSTCGSCCIGAIGRSGLSCSSPRT